MDKSDIVGKAASLPVQESITMPEETTSQKNDAARREGMMPIDDPVGAALRRLHDAVVAEPLPDDFLRLLSEIESKLDGTKTAE